MNEQPHHKLSENDSVHDTTSTETSQDISTEQVSEQPQSGQTAWELIRGSLQAAWQQPRLIAWYLLMYIGAIIALLLPIGLGIGLVESGNYSSASIGLGIAVALVGVVAGVTLMIANTAAVLFSLVQDESVSYWAGWRLGWPNVWSLLLLSFISSLVLVTGFTLLVIPGIALAGYVVLSQIVLAKEGKRGIDALVRSTQLIYGAWWPTVGRIALAMLIFLGITLVIELVTALVPGSFGDTLAGLLSYLVQGFFVVFFITAMYRWYQERAAVTPDTTWPSVQRGYIVAAWVGALLMVAAPLLGGALVYSQLQSEMMWSDAEFEAMLEAEMQNLE